MGRLDGAQRRAVSHAPYHAFVKRWHELAMPPKDHAVGTEIQQGVVEGAGPCGTLGDADGHRHVMGAACGSDALRGALSAGNGVEVDRRRLDSGDDSHDMLLS